MIAGTHQPGPLVVEAGKAEGTAGGSLYPAAGGIGRGSGLQVQAGIRLDGAAIAEGFGGIACCIGNAEVACCIQGTAIADSTACPHGDRAAVRAHCACITDAGACAQRKITPGGFHALVAVTGGAQLACRGQCHVLAAFQLGLAKSKITTAGAKLKCLAAVQHCSQAADGQTAEACLPLACAAPLGAIDIAVTAEGGREVTTGVAAVVIALTVAVGRIGQCGAAQAQVLSCDDGTASHTQVVMGCQCQILARADTARIHLQGGTAAIGADIDIAGGRYLVVQQDAALCGQGEVAAIGRGIAQHAHAHPGFSRYQENAVGVHAAQRCGINGIARRCALRCGAAGDAAAGVVPAIGADINAKVRHIHLATDADRAADQVENLLGRSVDAAAIDQDVTLGDVEAGQAAVAAQYRQAGAEGDAIGVDETAAGAGNAVGVGHHHIGAAAQHFGKTCQGAAIAADHLIENQAGFIA